MTQFSVNTHRFDPYKNFKFRVMWDGRTIAGISKVSSLLRVTETVTHRDGNDSSSAKKSPAATSFEPITLERGLTHDTAFEEWANMVYSMEGDPAVSLKNYKKDLVITLLNLQGTPVLSYHVYHCWVSEYQALPELDANNGCTAIEKIVLQHEGWVRDTEVGEPAET